MKKHDMSEARARMYRVKVWMHRGTFMPDHTFVRVSSRKVSQAQTRIIKDMERRFPDYYMIEVNIMTCGSP